MDIFNEPLENQGQTLIQQKGIAAFGLTLQGASHISREPPVPCQDCHGMRWLAAQGLLIAAIADGVGSCALSHFGARSAVSTALDSAQQGLEALSQGAAMKLSDETPGFRGAMKKVMVEAFRAARQAVEDLADSGRPPQPVFALQSTLTLAIYDGDYLFYGHVGDDGIVAQQPDGTVEMATQRVKGEEANSVFPLQSGEQYWQFGVTPHVAGFVMATDGVLDSFVASGSGAYFNGICYAFMEKAMYTLAERKPGSPKRALEEYRRFLQTADYLRQVADDLTMVAVVNPKAIRDGVHPDFSMDTWRAEEEALRQTWQKALYGQQPVKAVTPPPPAQKPREAPVEPWDYPLYRGSATLSFLKGVLSGLVVLVAFSGGITLGRTVLLTEHKELAQSYSELRQNTDGLDTLIDALEARLEEKDSRIQALEEELDRLRQEQDDPTEATQPPETTEGEPA
ncbi:MAG: protein phosphatase 2C domain-containing protein [Eubacteriales bacterium]|nr:protein phosphatase 2C domain-containing protein [Eubacteriales bacterium]